MLNGVTVKFGGDQAKLMENLSKSVTGSPKGVYSGKGQPKEDLLKSGKDFATIIPTGFLVLHKDLQELIKNGGGGGGGKMGNIASMIPTMFAAAGAVAIAGMVVAGLFGGMSGNSKSKIGELVDEMNNRLTVDDLLKDPEVVNAQRTGVALYVKSYFIAQAADAVITAAMGAVGSGAAAAVENLVGGLLGKETKDDAQLHLKELIDNIIIQQKPEDWQPGGQFWDDKLQGEVKAGIMTYLGVWFASQAITLGAETYGAAIGGAVGSVFTSLFNKLKGEDTEPESTTRLKELIDAIICGQEPDQWAPGGEFYDDDLKKEVKIGIMTYLGLWFAAQAVSMTVETAGSAIGGAIGNVFKGFMTAIGEMEPEEDAASHLKDIIDAIICGQEPEKWAPGGEFYDDALRTEVKIGIMTYLGLWFAAQAVAMTVETAGSAVGGAIGNVFKGLFTSIGAMEPEEDAASHLKALIDAIIMGQDPESWAKEATDTSSSLYTEVKIGIQTYLAIWFAAQAAQLTVESAASTVGSAIGSFFGGIFGGLFGKKEESPLETKINEIIDSVVNHVKGDDPELLGSQEIKAGVNEGIASYIKTYFQMMAAQAVVSKTASGVGEAVGNAAKKVWNWLTGKKEEDTTDPNDPMNALGTKLNSVLITVVDKVDPNALNQSDYDTMIIEGISAFVSAYFANFADAAEDADNKTIKGLIKDDTQMSNAIISVYRKLFSNLGADENIEDLTKKVKTQLTSSVTDLAKEIFAIENKKIKDNYSSSLSKTQINSALSAVSDAYLKAVKDTISASFNISASTSVTQEADSKVLLALNNIQAQLAQLTGNTEDIKGNQGMMAGLYAASIGADESSNAPAISSLSGSEE